MTVYEVWPIENDPDNGPQKPPAQGMWVWWRTGLHPMGRYEAVNFNGDYAQSYYQMKKDFPIMQDKALGPPSDFGGSMCHACGYLSDGYPEPDHRTICDGICKREGCTFHGEGAKQQAWKEFKEAYDRALELGVTYDEIRQAMDS